MFLLRFHRTLIDPELRAVSMYGRHARLLFPLISHVVVGARASVKGGAPHSQLAYEKHELR